MANPAISGNFGDLLDPRFQEIVDAEFTEQPDMVPVVFEMVPHNGRNDIRWSSTGDFDDWTEFSGTVAYDEIFQGYDVTATFLEWVSGFQIERALFDDDQYSIMDQRPRGLATSAVRTRQKHGTRIYNNAFSVDTKFYNNSEGVALCSNSHTTTATGVSTATGFDNLTTTSLTATGVSTARIQMVNFRNDRAGRIQVEPDELVIPPDLYEEAYEIVSSQGKVDVATNNRNVHEGRYRIIELSYLTDANNWFMQDSRMKRMNLFWVDRIPMEFASAEDLDTLVAKFRGYMRYAYAWRNWRFILGAQVS